MMWYLFSLAVVLTLVVLGHLAARIAAMRIRANPDPHPPDGLRREPQGETVFIARPDGSRIRAVVAGQGPAVVLAHGFSMTLQEWSLVWDLLLQAGFRVIAFDQRGHGRSAVGADGIGSRQMAEDYKAVLEHFDVSDSVLVGHSMGGFLAVVFLLTFPEVAVRRLRGVVLSAATAGNVTKGSVQNRVQAPLVRWGLLRILARSQTYGLLFGRSLYGKLPSPTGIQVFLEIVGAQDHQILMPILEALIREDYYPRLGEIRTPCVVICGSEDRATPPWHSRRLAAEIPDARPVWVEGKGHLLNWEAPDSLVDAVRSLRPGRTTA